MPYAYTKHHKIFLQTNITIAGSKQKQYKRNPGNCTCTFPHKIKTYQMHMFNLNFSLLCLPIVITDQTLHSNIHCNDKIQIILMSMCKYQFTL